MLLACMERPYSCLTEADYDTKLREIGNYLWELEQELLTADARREEALVKRLQQKISDLAGRADRFFEVQGGHSSLAAYVAGLGLRIIGDWPAATDRFLKVLELSPTNGDAWLELSWCLAETENWAECEMAARRGTEFFPETGAVWGNLAFALEKLGRPDEALSAARTALRLDPDDARCQELRSRLEAKDELARGN